MAEVELAGVRILLVHREVDDPAEVEPVLGRQPELAPDDVARLARHRLELRRQPAEEEHRVALAQAHLRRIASVRSGPSALATGPAASMPPSGAPEDVAHPRQPLALGVGVHPVAEGAAAAARRRDRADLGARLLQEPGEDLEARAAEMLGDDLHLDRVAQVGLVGAVPAASRRGRRCAGTPASPAGRRRSPRRRRASPARSPRRRRPAWRSSSPCRAGRTRRASGRRADPRRGSRARSGSSGRSPRP